MRKPQQTRNQQQPGGTEPGRRSPPQPAGLATRQAAQRVVTAVLTQDRTLDAALVATDKLEPRDRAFVRLIAVTVLRRLGELEAVLNSFIERPLPKSSGPLRHILLVAAAQLLTLETPPHAAISLAVDQARADRDARHFDKLANAVLRRVATEGPAKMTGLDPIALNVPGWLMTRWQRHYGDEAARAIAEAQLREAPLDLTLKPDISASAWAERLGGTLLPTGSIRLMEAGRIEELAGFAEGAWWVQDVAATLPARLLGAVAGLRVADLCAAPGGKTAQLASAGAKVTAVDNSEQRLKRLSENLARLQLAAETVVADVAQWQPATQFDAVLLDWPCTATGTVRRNPDILHLRRESDVAALAGIQHKLIEATARLVAPGGRLVACVCSLEPEEGPQQISRFLAHHPEFTREPVTPDEASGRLDWITPDGDLRTLPNHAPLPGTPGGMDGFYATRLRRRP